MHLMPQSVSQTPMQHQTAKYVLTRPEWMSNGLGSTFPHTQLPLATFLIHGFTSGYHTGLITLPHLTHACRNLLSASTDELAIGTLLQSELGREYIINPFTEPPFMIRRVSPIGLVKGKFSNKLRLVYDLSAPRSYIPSLTSLIPSEKFALNMHWLT